MSHPIPGHSYEEDAESRKLGVKKYKHSTIHSKMQGIKAKTKALKKLMSEPYKRK